MPRAQEPAPRFRTPQYAVKGDVEYFIARFTEVVYANQWTEGATLLHLRETLGKQAEDCRWSEDQKAIFNALQAKFGLSTKQVVSRIDIEIAWLWRPTAAHSRTLPCSDICWPNIFHAG